MKQVLKKVLAVTVAASMVIPMFVYAQESVGTSDKAVEMYQNTYANLTDRISDRGYAPTSLTGAYEGMFIRDSSIQIMAQNAYGDYQKSRNVLDFLLSYQQAMDAQYAQHIVPDYDDVLFDNSYLSSESSNEVVNTYSSQTFTDHALFGLRSPNNGGGVSFQADSNEIKSISIFTNTTGNDVLMGSLRTKIEDASTEIAYKEITVTSNGWQTFTFDKPLKVTAGETYYFFVQSNNGIAMFGKADGKPSDNAINGYNYDIPVLGGFAQSAYPAFKLNQDENAEEDHSFMSNKDHSIGLFLINSVTHNSAFAFVPNTDSIRYFDVYLTGNAPVTFKLTTEPGNESKTIETVSQTVNTNGWQRVDFGKNIPVTPNQKYYVHIATTSGSIVAYGTTAFEGSVTSMNWENNVWSQTPYVIAAEVFSEVNVAANAHAQKLSFNGDVIQAVTFNANAKNASGQFVGELRESLSGNALAFGKTNIVEGNHDYTIDFGYEIEVDPTKDYYFVLKAENNDYVQWNYNAATRAEAYVLKNDTWAKASYDFECGVLPLYSGEYRVPVLTIGKDQVGVQQIPSLNQYITAVDVLLGKNNDETGSAVATLYKGYGESALVVDEKIIDLSKLSSNGQMIHLEFGLSLEKVNKEDAYYLEIKAPNNSEGTLTWYGSKTIDRYQTYQNDQEVSGEAGFVAYKSNVRSLSGHVQIDGNYMLIHAWNQFVNGCKDTEENRLFIEKTYPIIKRFANYYIDNGYVSDEYKLMRNDSFEHSREGRYWKSYDLITNVFASQALYELSAIAKSFNDSEAAEKWMNVSTVLSEGINEHLITEVDGLKIYAELYDIEHGMNFVKGMSWVNWAPMAAEWYAMDQEIMQNTYDIYAKYDSQDYEGYSMIDACYDFNTNSNGGHVIGKGLAWEIMFNRVKNDDAKLDYLTNFILDHSTEGGVYPETYQPGGHFSDVGNQEHASWQHYAMSFAYPELTKTYSLNQLNDCIEEIQNMDKSLYTEESVHQLMNVLKEALKAIECENITKEECENWLQELKDALNNLVYLEADYSKVEDALAQIPEDLSKYTKESVENLQKAIDSVEKGLPIIKQEEVDAMADSILKAIDELVENISWIDLEPSTPIENEKEDNSSDTSDSFNLLAFEVLLLISTCTCVFLKKRRSLN